MDVGGKGGIHILIPIVCGLVFIRTYPSRIGHIGSVITCLRCVASAQDNRGVVVPSRRVRHFVTITNACRRRLLCFHPSRLGLSGNAGIHIANNSFRNRRNVFLGIGNTHSHHLIVGVRNIVTITVTSVRPSLVRMVGWFGFLG